MGYPKALSVLAITMLLSLPVYGDRGNADYRHGLSAEKKADLDAASGYYKKAHELSPANAKYYSAYTQTRFKAAMQHVHNGQQLRNSGALEEAAKEFETAAQIDGTCFVAEQELRLTAELIQRRQKERSTPKIESPLAKLAADSGKAIELQPISDGPITFKMVADADAVYKVVCKMAGINVLFDPDYRSQKLKVDLSNVTLLQALDMLALQSKTYWRPVAPNTIFITADSAAKRKDFEQNFMKTFYLENISTPNELQEAATVVGKILDVSRIQLLQAQDALVVRGTMDQMVLVERLLSQIDKPRSEVFIDVAVMEVDRDSLHTIGATLPTTATASYLPTAGTGSSGSGGGPTITAGSFGITLGGASFTALASNTNSKVLQNPSIRVLNDEKATLRIGDRVPIATGSFASGLVGGGSVSPLISTQFQYLDVGVNIDITPHIHGNGQVTLKMSLEISTVSGEQDIGGITEPVIGQRRIEHETELADGEVNLLGGILEDSETHSLSGYPWIVKIPILRELFGQEHTDHQHNEIVFAITPHIVRTNGLTPEDLRLVEVGTGNATELRRNPSNAAVASVAGHPADQIKQGHVPEQAPPANPPAGGSPNPVAPPPQTAPPSPSNQKNKLSR